MNAPVTITRDRGDLALVGIVAGLSDLRHGGDPVLLVDFAADILRHRLGPTERGWLLMTAAQAAEPEHLDALAVAVVDRAGAPVPALGDMRAEARDWADFASLAERRAYLAACWHRLADKDRAAFLKAARKVTA